MSHTYFRIYVSNIKFYVPNILLYMYRVFCPEYVYCCMYIEFYVLNILLFIEFYILNILLYIEFYVLNILLFIEFYVLNILLFVWNICFQIKPLLAIKKKNSLCIHIKHTLSIVFDYFWKDMAQKEIPPY